MLPDGELRYEFTRVISCVDEYAMLPWSFRMAELAVVQWVENLLIEMVDEKRLAMLAGLNI